MPETNEDAPSQDYRPSSKSLKIISSDNLTFMTTTTGRQAGDTSIPLNTITENEQLQLKQAKRRGHPNLLGVPRRDRSLSNESHESVISYQAPFVKHSKNLSEDSNSSGSQSTNNEFERGGEGYFLRVKSPTTDHLQPNDISLREASRSILYALTQILKAVTQFTSFTGNERIFAKELRSANKVIEELVNSLEIFDNDSLTRRPDGDTCACVLQSCQSCISVFRSLISSLQYQLRTFTQSPDDIRYSRTLLLMLNGSIAEIKFAWENISPLLKEFTPYTNMSAPFRARSLSRSNNNSPSYLGAIPSSTNIVHPLPPSVIFEQLMNKVEVAIASFEHVLQILVETVEQSKHSAIDGSQQRGLITQNQIKDLMSNIMTSKDVTKHLKRSLLSVRTPSPKAEYSVQVRFQGDTFSFIQTIVKLGRFVKDEMHGFPRKQELKSALSQVTKSNMELASLLKELGAQDATNPLLSSPSTSYGEHGYHKSNSPQDEPRKISISVENSGGGVAGDAILNNSNVPLNNNRIHYRKEISEGDLIIDQSEGIRENNFPMGEETEDSNQFLLEEEERALIDGEEGKYKMAI
ncbi:hypothetical protein G9A89_021167 [Geosiphon pyriformis]|nr:hypothetical protein G9A89_021167 [Geosiphon pyriformis]